MRPVSYILFFILSCSAIYSQTTTGFREVIHRADLERSGAVRLSDIFLIVNKSFYHTKDGYRFNANLNGMSGWETSEWILMLDSVRFDMALPDYLNINLLPVSPGEIDSVEIIYRQGIYASEFNTGGIIHIHSLKADKEFEVSGRLMGGNITGDPGPYKFTGYSSENIDQIGPDYSLRLDLGTAAADFRVSAKREVHFSTFREFQQRNPYLKWEYMQLNLTGYTFSAEIKILPGKHRIFFGRTVTGDAPVGPYGTDLVFIDQAAIEIPSETKLTQAALSGTFDISGMKLNYRTKISSGELNKPADFSGPHYDWRLRNYLFGAELINSLNPVKFTLGGEIESRFLRTDYDLTKNSFISFKAYGNLKYNFADYFETSLDALFARMDGENAVKFSLLNSADIDRSNSLLVNLAYYQTLPAEKNNLWYWRSNGYRFLEDIGAELDIPEEPEKESTASIEAIWQSSLNRDISFSFGGFYRYFIESIYQNGNFGFDSNRTVQLQPTFIDFQSESSNIGINFTVSHRLSDQFKHMFFYGYYRYLPVSGTDNRFPSHRISYTIDFLPVESFSMWSKLTYLSNAEWTEYSSIFEQSQGLYNPVISRKFLFDAALNKWLWEKKLRLTLLFRNILNQNNNSHPLGASLDLAVLLQLEFTFGTEKF